MERIGNPKIGARRPPARQLSDARKARSLLADFVWTCTSNMNSKPHCGAAAFECRRGFSRLLTASARYFRQRPPLPTRVAAPAGRFLVGYRRRLLIRSSAARWRHRRIESSFRLAPVIFPRETTLADVPDALTRCSRNLSPSARSSYGPRQGIGKPALRLGAKSPGSRVPPGPVVRAFRFRLTTRA
jgi:hypothetical protein